MKRGPAKRAPLGTTPEQLLDDMKRVYLMQGEIGVHVYVRHGTYPKGAIIRHFGGWNEALRAAHLPVTHCLKVERDDEGDELAPTKRTKYPCLKCDKPFRGIGRRNGNFHCLGCAEENTRLSNGAGW